MNQVKIRKTNKVKSQGVSHATQPTITRRIEKFSKLGVAPPTSMKEVSMLLPRI